MNKSFFVSFGIIIFSVLIFFQQFIFFGRLPIPSDTIIGLYQPFRDLYAKNYPNGIPYKNFLITDPVRQQYPWRNLGIETLQKKEIPLWDPYNFSGSPLLANIQSATLYPGNIFFSFLPFSLAWSILILLQPLLAGIFLYLYLRSLRIGTEGSILGAITFSFSGFFIAWLEWGTILHVALWLPLLLLSTDKIVDQCVQQKVYSKNRTLFIWALIFVFALTSSFLAGHLQTFFYLYLFLLCYFFTRWVQKGKIFAILFVFLLLTILFLIVTFIQWYPTLQLILLSARDVDQSDWTKIEWFIPWQHAIQFIVPDFFGNPASLNYWSEWNYAEFVGYIGIIPFLMALLAVPFRRDKKTLFFGIMLLFSLFFAFPTFLAKIPYIFSIPFLSTTQPTRLLFIIDFCLAVLAAFGFDYFIKNMKKSIYPLVLMTVFFSLLWGFVLFGRHMSPVVSIENIQIAKRNLVFPSVVFFTTILFCFLIFLFQKKKYIGSMLIYMFIAITVFDLIRFGTKFTPFTIPAYLFPQTSVTQFLQNQPGKFRYMTTNSQILPPNFSSLYHLQTVDGYDPIYLKRYGELIAASERGRPDISSPFGFNRIITPHNYDSKIMDLLHVKYVLSLSDITSSKLKKVFQEGKTQVYENKLVFPRVFFVDSVQVVSTKQKTIDAMFDPNVDLRRIAMVDDDTFLGSNKKYRRGKATIEYYGDNQIIITTKNKQEGFLVLTDIYYPLWKAIILSNNNTQRMPLQILRTDYTLRGMVVPSGTHTIIVYTKLL